MNHHFDQDWNTNSHSTKCKYLEVVKQKECHRTSSSTLGNCFGSCFSSCFGCWTGSGTFSSTTTGGATFTSCFRNSLKSVKKHTDHTRHNHTGYAHDHALALTAVYHATILHTTPKPWRNCISSLQHIQTRLNTWQLVLAPQIEEIKLFRLPCVYFTEH